MKNKLNFNIHSYTAWLTLAGALLSTVLAIAKVCGYEITPEQTKDVTMIVTAVLNVFVALGIISAPTDKKGDDNNE